tara:strand:+ start:4442 stop:4606 length:165 start_codon:yes stop_codon:yes gene_type:complete
MKTFWLSLPIFSYVIASITVAIYGDLDGDNTILMEYITVTIIAILYHFRGAVAQ